MNFLRRKQGSGNAELEEWERHHDDPRSAQGLALFSRAVATPDLSVEDLWGMWLEANSLVGKRSPADYGEFLAYGYLDGRIMNLVYGYLGGRKASGGPRR